MGIFNLTSLWKSFIRNLFIYTHIVAEVETIIDFHLIFKEVHDPPPTPLPKKKKKKKTMKKIPQILTLIPESES